MLSVGGRLRSSQTRSNRCRIKGWSDSIITPRERHVTENIVVRSRGIYRVQASRPDLPVEKLSCGFYSDARWTSKYLSLSRISDSVWVFLMGVYVSSKPGRIGFVSQSYVSLE